MRMSQVYQPVMLTELLLHQGHRTTTEIARALLGKDPTQVEYYEQIVNNMVGKVLTKNRNITEKNGETYQLKGFDSLSPNEITTLIALLDPHSAHRGHDLERIISTEDHFFPHC